MASKLKRKVEELISPIAQNVWSIKQAYKKGREERKQLNAALSSLNAPSVSPVKLKKADLELKNVISGLGELTQEERDAKYKAAAQEWEARKELRDGKTINSHERNSGEMEK